MPSLNQPSSKGVKTRFHQPAIDSFNDDDVGENNREEQSQIESSSSSSPNYMKPTTCSYSKKGSGTSHQASSNNSESSFDVSESDSWKPNAVSFGYVKPAVDSSSTRLLSLKSNNTQLRKRNTRVSPFPSFADYLTPGQEGNESEGSTSGCSSSEDRELKGKIQLKKTLNKSRSSRRGSFRSSFRSPNYLKATSSSQKKMQIQASLVDSELSSLDHDKTIRNLKSSTPKSASSGYKSTQKNLFRRTTSIRTVKILINKSTFKPRRDVEKNFSQCPHDIASIRPTCSSTQKNSNFPQHLDLHPGESESERKTVMDLCPYSYCSLHGHQHKPPVPPLKRLLSKRRRYLKSQRTMKLRSQSSLRGKNLDHVIKELGLNQAVVDGYSEIEERYPGGEEEGSDLFVQIYTKSKMGLSRRSSEGYEHASLDEVPSPYVGQNDVQNADLSRKSSIADGISEATEENTDKEVGAEADKHDGDLATGGAVVGESNLPVDSEANTVAKEEYKPQLQKNNRISMWNLIHQNLVSGLAEDEHKHGDGGSNSPTPQSSHSSYHEKDSQEVQLQKMCAIKMVREAIEKILLPEVQDQLSDDQSVSSNATYGQELLDKNNGEGDEQIIRDITVNEVLETAHEVTSVKEEAKIEKRSLKNWSNLKKLILLKRFVKALEKVKTLKLRGPQHLPLEPGPEAEKVSLRRGVLDSKKSSEAWMLDYALQQVVSELAPIQKRKVALLVKAFETVVSPSGEPLTPVIFPRSKVTRESSGINNKLEKVASEVNSHDMGTQKTETFSYDNGQDFTISVEQSYVHAEVKENEVVHEEIPRASSECCKEDDHDSNTERLVIGNLSDATGGTPIISEKASSNDLVHASISDTVISPVSASSPVEQHTATAEEKADEFKLNSDTVEGVSPVRDSGPNSNSQETQKARFKKERRASMWHMVHRQMVAGLSEESNNHLEKEADEQLDGVSSLVATKSSNSSPGFSSSARNVEGRYDEHGGQEVELRKIYAIKLVRDAIERILLPELEDQPCIDKKSAEEVTSDPLICTGYDEDSSRECESIKVSDDTLLGEEEPRVKIALTPETGSLDVASVAQSKSEKQTPKGWSNLKKLILLKRFMKELEKVKKFNPRKPRFLPLLPDEEAEQVRLRSQMMDERRNAEEWMLDYALRKVVSELAPKQKRKVELLVKAFETVAPSSEEPQVKVTFPKLKGISGESYWNGRGLVKSVSKDADADKESEDALKLDDEIEENCSTISNKSSDVFAHEEDATSGLHEKLLNNGSESHSKHEKINPLKNVAEPSTVTENEMESGRGHLEASRGPFKQLSPVKEKTIDSATDCTTEVERPTQLEKQKHIKMWHLLCQHVVSSIDAKVETLLDGDDEYDQVESPSITPRLRADYYGDKEDVLSRQDIRFSRRSAVQLVRDAIEEILQPDVQDDSSDAQSNASDSIMEQELEEKNRRVFGAFNILTPTSSVEDSFGTEIEKNQSPDEPRAVSNEGSMFSQQKSKNWSKLKKVILLKRTIRALEKARKSNTSVPRSLPLAAPDMKEEKVDLKHQSADERKKAEEWMLDYALQHAVDKLTPARKRRVSMLVEAFEAVVPVPQG